MPSRDTPALGAGDLSAGSGIGKPDTEELLSLLWRQAGSHALVLLDPEGFVVGWGAASEQILGYTEAEALGRHVSFIFTDDDVARGMPELEISIARAAGWAEDDRWHIRRDGTQIWIAGTIVALKRNGAVIGFTKIMRDRTDLRAQFETMENRAHAAALEVCERDVFFTRIAHEVRNSLGPIRAVMEVIERTSESEQLQVPMTIMKRQIAVMERMMCDLSEVARIGIKKLRLSKVHFDLAAEVAEVAETCRSIASRKHLDLAVLRPPTAVMVDADRDRIHQVAFNLIHNAIKYTPDGGQIWVKLTVESNEAVLKVKDTGIGITPQLLPLIFDLFTQENPGNSDGGFGVGLSLVKEFVDAHEGFVEVRSDGKGKGSEFSVRLPM